VWNAKAKFVLDGAHCHNGPIGQHLHTPLVRHEAEFHPKSEYSYIDAACTMRIEAFPIPAFSRSLFKKNAAVHRHGPRRIAALVTKTAQRVANPMRELGSKHAEVRAPAQAKFL